jgi:3-oxoacyl-[acyl-carrier protein] reductase
MADIDAGNLARSASELASAGHKVHHVALDLADEEQLSRLTALIDTKCAGRIDLLVNNAGGWRYATAAEIKMPDWDWTFRTNLESAFLTTRAVMQRMIDRGYGRIVNVASTDAHRAKPTLPHYAAAKAALVSLTRSLAAELAPHQVLVNAVSPGAIATEVAKSQSWFEERIRQIPVGRAAEPEDIAEAILFLGSPRNRFVVGQTLMVNGGLLMN